MPIQTIVRSSDSNYVVGTSTVQEKLQLIDGRQLKEILNSKKKKLGKKSSNSLFANMQFNEADQGENHEQEQFSSNDDHDDTDDERRNPPKKQRKRSFLIVISSLCFVEIFHNYNDFLLSISSLVRPGTLGDIGGIDLIGNSFPLRCLGVQRNVLTNRLLVHLKKVVCIRLCSIK